MTYRVDLTERAERDLRHLCLTINGQHSTHAKVWFNRMEIAILGLAEMPARNPTVPEDTGLRLLLYGRGRNADRIIYAIDEPGKIVTVLHIRHGAQGAFIPEGSD